MTCSCHYWVFCSGPTCPGACSFFSSVSFISCSDQLVSVILASCSLTFFCLLHAAVWPVRFFILVVVFFSSEIFIRFFFTSSISLPRLFVFCFKHVYSCSWKHFDADSFKICQMILTSMSFCVGIYRLPCFVSVEIIFVLDVVSDLGLQPRHLGVTLWNWILFKSLSRAFSLRHRWGTGVLPGPSVGGAIQALHPAFLESALWV